MSKIILDACCGSRMFWFDKNNPNVDFCDCRKFETELCDCRKLKINPDIIADFTKLPFDDNTYNLVVFDPPHLINVGDNSWLAQKYGKLPKENWQEILSQGFNECMRVLKPNGVLIFKWNETDISVTRIIEIIGKTPLFGHKSGKRNQTHWLCFMKFELRSESMSNVSLIDGHIDTKTNYDRIRDMSIDEIATAIYNGISSDPCDYCKYNNAHCTGVPCREKSNVDIIAEWLKSEAET